MEKIRVYDLAKELGVSSKDAIGLLADLGIEVKSHSSSIPHEAAAALREQLGVQTAAAADTSGNGAATVDIAAPKPPGVVEKISPQKAKDATSPEGELSREGADSTQAPAEDGGRDELQPAGTEVADGSGSSSGLLQVPRGIIVQELAERLDRTPAELIKTLLGMGLMVTVTQSLPDDTLQALCGELGAEIQVVTVQEEIQEHETAEVDSPEDLAPRPPVVTVMGHIDHGKTSLLDAIRLTDVVTQEAGGITQKIGAYQVHVDGKSVTFLDTPGHEAFTQMRARGAQVTDVAVLVVAADDGVKPQTLEAIDHATAAGVPLVVAVNKIDRPDADPQRVRQQLAERGHVPEEWGGSTIYVDVSAKQRSGLPHLLEIILLLAEINELKANPKALASGVAIESHLGRGRGTIATMIVQRGTLRVGDPVVCGAAWGKIRAMFDENGRHLKEAPPGTPVQVLGWNGIPNAGDEFHAAEDEKQARRQAQEREGRLRRAEHVSVRKPISLEELLSRTKEGETPELMVILKADLQGSLDALEDSLAKMDQSLVRITVLRRGAGAISENDVRLAQASGAIVVGFNVRPDARAREIAENEGVDVRTYQIIYQVLDDIQKASRGLLAPEKREVVLGSAEVRNTFRVPKTVVAGCYVTEGAMIRGASARLLREGTVVYEGRIATLRRFKEDVRDVATGYECGVGLENFSDVKERDVIEVFEIREIARV